MSGILAAIGVMALVALVLVRLMLRRRGRVEVLDAEGRRRLVPPRINAGGFAPCAVIAGIVLLMMVSVRVVPVGHALVIFNTISKGFRLARQGVTFVPPFIAQTEDYDLRRLEYTTSGLQGEGRRTAVDDSLWSPTQEGLQVGINITVWHHLDRLRVI
jgi:hypothetical protein